jgi:predicted metal-dependent HD superfamily phosphohydrolase
MNPDLMKTLEASWLDLATRWGAAPELARSIFEAIVEAYREPGRRYHTLDHVASVLGVIERFGPGDDPDALRLAAWYHDVVYDTRAADNEERSADRARDDLRRLNAPASLVDRVVGLVLATKDHRIGPGDRDGALFLDADLAILGSEEDYEAYAEGIAFEYGWVPAEAYAAGRAEVLGRFLRRERIYLTDAIHELLDAPARRNMARERGALEGGG